MDITSELLGYGQQISGTYGVANIPKASGRPKGAGTDSPRGGSGGTDTVSISQEARELFARKLKAARSAEEQSRVTASLAEDKGGAPSCALGSEPSPDSADQTDGAAEGSPRGGSGGVGESPADSADQQIQDLEGQLQELANNLSSIMSGPGEPDVKAVQAAPVESRMQQIQSQIQQLKQQQLQQQLG